METAYVKTNFGVGFFDWHENPERSRQILSLNTGDGLIPLTQSLDKRHSGWLRVHSASEQIQETPQICSSQMRKCDDVNYAKPTTFAMCVYVYVFVRARVCVCVCVWFKG